MKKSLLGLLLALIISGCEKDGPKDAVFEPGAHYGVTNTDLELEVVAIYPDAVLLKDTAPDTNTYYLTIKTSYSLFSSNGHLAVKQLWSIWWNSSLQPYRQSKLGGPQVNGAFAGYSRDLLNDMSKDVNGTIIFKQMVSQGPAKLVVTGHSMAGAIAQVFAAELAEYAQTTKLPLSVSAVVSGSPRVGDEAFKKFVEDELKVHITRFTLMNDSVSGWLPMAVDPITCFPGISNGFRSMGEAIYLDSNNLVSMNPDDSAQYGHCSETIGWNMADGYWGLHLPSAYLERYQAIQKQVDKDCATTADTAD